MVSLLSIYFVFSVPSVIADTPPDYIGHLIPYIAIALIGVSPGFAVSIICPFYLASLRRGGPRVPLYEGLAILAAFPTAFPFCLGILGIAS